MTNKHKITWEELHHLIREFRKVLPKGNVYGVPRGGAIIAELLNSPNNKIVYNPNEADMIVDDIYDSGRTHQKYAEEFPNIPFHVLIDKREKKWKGEWIEFPYEKPAEREIEDNIVRILEYIGEDASREGLKDTPKRVVKSWEKLFGGYFENPRLLVRLFDKETYSQMVILKDIEFYSTCEHHMLPFFGKAHIAYIPDKKVIGISKLARLLEIYSRRLQIQERLTEEITTFLMDEVKAEGAGCILEAQHLCMISRGVEKQHSVMTTSSLKGSFMKPEVRQEFINLINRKGL